MQQMFNQSPKVCESSHSYSQNRCKFYEIHFSERMAAISDTEWCYYSFLRFRMPVIQKNAMVFDVVIFPSNLIMLDNMG